MARFARLVALLVLLSSQNSSSSNHRRRSHNEQLSNDEYELLLDVVNELKTNEVSRSEGSSVPNYECSGASVNPPDPLGEAQYCIGVLEQGVREWTNRVSESSWIYETNLTDHNADQLTEVDNEFSKWYKTKAEWSQSIVRHADPSWDKFLVRKLHKLAFSTEAKNENTQRTISRLQQRLTSIYSRATVTENGTSYHLEPDLGRLLAQSTDWDKLMWAWLSWRDVTGPLMRPAFVELIAAQNEAARDNGLADMGVAWRVSNFEVDNIEPMVDGLFQEILPLYEELHAYVRRKLVQTYPGRNINPRGPIPAHILGNMWAQTWTNILHLVLPYPDSASFDVTPALQEQGYTPTSLFRLSEAFFNSLGLDNMTDVFWEKSMITRPTDGRDVTCHASASDFTSKDCTDFRIKMCTEVNMGYLKTIHHEMGHIQYFMEYCPLSVFFHEGANSAFHEAIGDTIALSVGTPDHLRAIGLLPNDVTSITPDEQQKRDINYLMQEALTKVAFLPLGYLIDKWRWNVFRGAITDNLNAAWWEYRREFQGVIPPVERTEKDFDPGAKYHIAASVPYIRYFLSYIGQFQFHKALCDAKGHTGPLHHCDIYRSRKTGELLKRALKLGSSVPWPEVMETLTGQRDFNTGALFEYFGPLYEWLQKQNRANGVHVGW